jgi:energy-coupling factor transporter ATP-binding protein EcfA2
MILNIVENKKILKDKFQISLPNFTVLTGGNGSGKTQLLTHIKDNCNGYWERMHESENQNTENIEIKMIFPILDDEKNNLTDVVYSFPGLRNFDNYFHNESPLIQQISQQWQLLKPLCASYNLIKEKTFINEQQELDELNRSIIEFVRNLTQDVSRFTDSNVKKAALFQLQQLKEISVKSLKNISDLTYIDFLIFYNIPTEIFSSALDLLFHQFYLKQKYYPSLTKNVSPPWDVFNSILKRANFKYKVEFNPSKNEEYPQAINLIDNEFGLTNATLDALSSGEKTIIALIFVLYHSSNNGKFPQVILFDEPDAHLHPSLTQLFLNVIQDVLVKEQNVKVIITTHSPSTIALSPSESIYKMDRKLGYPIKENRHSAVQELTNGLTSLTIEEGNLGIIYNIKNKNKNILFTEGITDKIILETVWQKLYDNEMPFYIQDSFSASFLGNLFNQGDENPDGIFVQFPEKKLIALFDFDQAGYSNWNRVKKFPKLIEKDPSKCLVRTNGENGFLILLPVSDKSLIKNLALKEDFETFKDKSNLIIESLFLEHSDVREAFFYEEKVMGGGSIYLFNADKQKRNFSEYIKYLDKKYFIEFVPLFNKILEICK